MMRLQVTQQLITYIIVITGATWFTKYMLHVLIKDGHLIQQTWSACIQWPWLAMYIQICLYLTWY